MLEDSMKYANTFFCDQVKNLDGSKPTGIPAFAGNAVGYHAVQAFLKETGITVEKATLIDGETIIKESGYFGYFFKNLW
jgi:uncharacterized protein YjaZ